MKWALIAILPAMLCGCPTAEQPAGDSGSAGQNEGRHDVTAGRARRCNPGSIRTVERVRPRDVPFCRVECQNLARRNAR